MNKIYVSIILIIFLWSFTSIAQPFAVGETDITFTDANRGNRNIPTTIFYPAAAAGIDVAPAAGQHCLVVFGHGFLISYTQYAWLANALVPQGYIVAFPDTETGFPSHSDFGVDIAFLVGAIQTEGINAASILFGAVSPNSAVGGHSMGGGASFLAADGNANINALFNFAAAETNPSAIAAAGNVLVPTLVFEGTDDCVTPSAGNSGDMYNALNTTCQALISITDASHCQFANSDAVCSLGQISCSGNISQGAQETEVTTYLLPFLNYHLKDDCDAGTTFDNLINNPTASTTQSNCMLPAPSCNSCAAIDLNINFDGFPAQTSWQITNNTTGNVIATSPSYNTQASNSNLTTSPACLPDGCYTLTFNDALNNGMCPFQSSAIGVSTFITAGTLITPGSLVGTLSLVAAPGLCGNYNLTDASGNTLATGGGNFGTSQSNSFCLTGGLGPKYGNQNNHSFQKNSLGQNNIAVFPNPANGIVFIKMPLYDALEHTQLNVFDISGKLVLSQQNINEAATIKLNVVSLKPGAYNVVITNKNGEVYNGSFVK